MWWLALLWICAFGKETIGKVDFYGKDVFFVDTFGCAVGECSWELSLRVVHPNIHRSHKNNAQPGSNSYERAVVKVRIVLDDAWESNALARNPTCSNIADNSRATRFITLPLDGTWSYVQTGQLAQYARPHHWYFVVDDCDDSIFKTLFQEGEGGNNVKVQLEWQFGAKQFNGSQLSYELFGTTKMVLSHILVSVLALLLVIRYHHSGPGGKARGGGRVHRMLQILILCLLLQMAGNICQLIHIAGYAKNGKGYHGFDLLSEVCSFTAQVALSSILVLISAGYSLNVPDTVKIDVVALPLTATIALFHLLLIVADRLTRDERLRYVGTAGWAGTIICIARILIWLGFLCQGLITMNKQTTTVPIRQFLKKFLFLGSIYFAAYPILFCAINLACHAYLQHRVLLNGIFAMQMLSIICLSYLFSVPRTEFFKVSEMAQSYLPGGYISPTGMYRLD